MSEPIQDALPIADVDRDGALRETAAAAAAAQAGGHTRARFLRQAGVAAGAGMLLSGATAGSALAQGGLPSGDVSILNFALTLEYLEATFYQEAVSGGKLSGPTASFASTVAAHEAAHVAALQKVLGSQAVKKPTFDFGNATTDMPTFQKTAMTFEDLGVMAYEGQAGNIKTPAILAAAASILSVEARHASWIRDIIGHGGNPIPAPDAFNPAETMAQVLAAVKSAGVIKS